jgi:hypothetical protein
MQSAASSPSPHIFIMAMVVVVIVAQQLLRTGGTTAVNAILQSTETVSA